MIINSTSEYQKIWNKVYTNLKFRPSCEYRGHSMKVELPFQLSVPYTVYSIENMTDAQTDEMDDIITKCLIRSSKNNQKWYALDWQHSAFIFNPLEDREMQSEWIKDERYFGGGYNAYFPSFYPDGDYFFFIDDEFKNGYLGHPWRQEIWVFGLKLQEEISKVHSQLGWKVIYIETQDKTKEYQKE